MSEEVAPGITIDSKVMAGKSVVQSTRIPVELVLAKISANPDLKELFADYPELTEWDVDNCLLYEARNNEPIYIADYPDLIPIVEDARINNRRILLMDGKRPLVLLSPITKK